MGDPDSKILADLESKIKSVGDEIREIKAAKGDFKPKLDELIALKTQYKDANGGVEYAPPKSDKEKEKKKKKEEPEQPKKDGPSKNELKKMQKKAEKKAKNAGGDKPVSTTSSGSLPPAPPNGSLDLSSSGRRRSSI